MPPEHYPGHLYDHRADRTCSTRDTLERLVIVSEMESQIPKKARCLSRLVEKAAADHCVGISPAVDLQIQLGMAYSS